MYWESDPKGKRIPLSRLSRGVIQTVEQHTARLSSYHRYKQSPLYMSEVYYFQAGRTTILYFYIGGGFLSYIKLSMRHV
jgi:hypothetical protein